MGMGRGDVVLFDDIGSWEEGNLGILEFRLMSLFNWDDSIEVFSSIIKIYRFQEILVM
jgi:hypothetical protein